MRLLSGRRKDEVVQGFSTDLPKFHRFLVVDCQLTAMVVVLPARSDIERMSERFHMDGLVIQSKDHGQRRHDGMRVSTHHLELAWIIVVKGEFALLGRQWGILVGVFHVLTHHITQVFEHAGQKAGGSFLNPVNVCHSRYYTYGQED